MVAQEFSLGLGRGLLVLDAVGETQPQDLLPQHVHNLCGREHTAVIRLLYMVSLCGREHTAVMKPLYRAR